MGVLNLRMRRGKKLRLSDIVQGDKPTLLIPVYYGCPRLCGLNLQGALEGLNTLKLDLADDFNVVTFSFNSEETSQLAKNGAAHYHPLYREPEKAKRAWHFLVGDEKNIQLLMEQIGFRAKRDGKEFAHAAALFFITPDLRISQYFTGLRYDPWDMKLALVEASQGKIGSAIDHILLYCFRFDPTKGKYTWAAFNVMRAGATFGCLLLFGIIFSLWRKERLLSK